MTMKRRRTKSTVEAEESMEKKYKQPIRVAYAVKTVHKSISSFKFRSLWWQYYNYQSKKKSHRKKKMARMISRETKIRLDRWLDLPNDIMESIMKRLFYVDLINFRAVCKSWNSINRRTFVTQIKQLPWLVIFDETSAPPLNRTSYSCKLVDPKYKKTYTVDTSNIDNFFIRKVYDYSKHGWLLILSDVIDGQLLLFAYSPFSSVNNFIELPTLESTYLEFATFTSNPSIDQDCLFIVLHDEKFIRSTTNNKKYFSNTFKISTCRRGDKLWSSRYLKYCGNDFVMSNCVRTGRWIYSEGNIYYVERLTRVVQLVKWEVMEISHSSIDDVLYGSLMKLDLDDDDTEYFCSKLRKDQSYIHYDIFNFGKEVDVYGSWPQIRGRTRLKIHPPSHQ